MRRILDWQKDDGIIAAAADARLVDVARHVASDMTSEVSLQHRHVDFGHVGCMCDCIAVARDDAKWYFERAPKDVERVAALRRVPDEHLLVR